MGIQNRDKEFPVRYSLRPADKKVIAQNLQRNGGATARQIKALARHKGVATKPIHALLEELHLPVLPEGTPCQIKKPKTLEERVFSRPEPAPEPKEAPPDTSLDPLLQLEQSMRADQDVLLAQFSLIEDELTEARGRAAEKEQEARDMMQKTAQLRRETRAEREAHEALKGDYSTVCRAKARLQGECDWLEQELKESMVRERKLLDALKRMDALVVGYQK